jgi:hypothetical protein
MRVGGSIWKIGGKRWKVLIEGVCRRTREDMHT